VETKKYIIRSCISPFIKKGVNGRITLDCLFQSSRIIKSFRIDTRGLKIFKMFNGSNTLLSISKKTSVGLEQLIPFVEILENENIIEPKEKDLIESDPKYKRQLNFFKSFEYKDNYIINFQEKLKKAHIAILGLGGIGTWVLESLVRTGVGSFTLIDPDRVALSNLTRQAIYTMKDINNLKVNVAAYYSKKINNEVHIKKVKKYISSISGLVSIIKDVNLIINCSDQPDVMITNNLVSKASFKLNLPHILCGGYDGHLSFIGQTVLPYKTSCWNCYLTNEKSNKRLNAFKPISVTQEAKEGGTLSPIAAITANIHVLEAIKTITGYAPPIMINTKGEIDFNSLQITYHHISKRRNCSLCRTRSIKQ